MNKIAVFCKVLVLAVCMLTAGAAAQDAPKPAEAVAVVNGTAIPHAAFEREFNAYLRRMAQEGQAPANMDLTAVRRQVVDNLVTGELLWQACKQLERVVTAGEVDAQIAEFRSQFGDADRFAQALAQAGLDDAGLRDLVERQKSIRNLVGSDIVGQIDIPEKDARALYDAHPEWFSRPERVKASHILFKADAGDTAEMRSAARAKAADVRKKAIGGEDFAALARQYSEGPSKDNGGDLGYFTRDRMVKPFADAAFALKAGEISDVVETEFGFHVIRVAEHQPEGLAPFEEVSEGIHAKLRREEASRRLEDYVNRLKEKAEITLNVPQA